MLVADGQDQQSSTVRSIDQRIGKATQGMTAPQIPSGAAQAGAGIEQAHHPLEFVQEVRSNTPAAMLEIEI